jgi:hypothetical protein
MRMPETGPLGETFFDAQLLRDGLRILVEEMLLGMR